MVLQAIGTEAISCTFRYLIHNTVNVRAHDIYLLPVERFMVSNCSSELCIYLI